MHWKYGWENVILGGQGGVCALWIGISSSTARDVPIPVPRQLETLNQNSRGRQERREHARA